MQTLARSEKIKFLKTVMLKIAIYKNSQTKKNVKITFYEEYKLSKIEEERQT